MINLVRAGNKLHLDLVGTGSSDHIQIPDVIEERGMTVFLSEVIGGTATLQWTISTAESVAENSARWHDWSVGAVDTVVGAGIVFSSNINFVRVVTDPTDTTTYVLELLI